MFSAKAAKWGARNGTLVVNGSEIATPSFIVSTTRGAVDHLTPDHASKATVSGVYAEELFDREGLVDSCLADRHRLPLKTSLLMGGSRKPGSRSIKNKPNTMDSLGIDTVQGSRLASLQTMSEFMAELKPDLFLVPYDVPAQSQNTKVGGNRLRKMEIRSQAWFDQFMTKRLTMGSNSGSLLLVASIPPELRTPEYMADINSKCDAYCFTESEVDAENKIPHELAKPEKLRLSDRPNTNWRQVLEDVSNGFDLMYVPLSQFSDAGQALSYQWKCDDDQSPSSFYMDLNDSKYTTDTTKLGKTDHSLAYVHHLLMAEEMTAQVLLQQHNMDMIKELFDGVRESIKENTFESDKNAFLKKYDL